MAIDLSGITLPPSGMNYTDPSAGAIASNMYSQDFLSAIKNNPGQSILGNQAFNQGIGMLSPGQGGLSPALLQMLGIGKQSIDANTSQNVSSTMSNALGKGMEGSSIELAGIQGAQAQGGNQLNSLLASIFGLQNQNTGQAAGSLISGGQQDVGYQQQDLMSLLSFLSGNADSAQSMGMFAYEQGQANMNADKANQTEMDAAILGLVGTGAGAAIKKWG